MTRRLTVALASVAVLLGVVACSGEAAAPATPSSMSSSVAPTPVVIVPGSSAPSSPVTPTPSSVGVPTPSVVDVPTPVAADPWPADLTPEQVADAQAAIAAYRGYWQVVDKAGTQPAQDWSREVRAVATGPAEAALLETLTQLNTRGRYAEGVTAVSPVVSSVNPALIVIEDCVDKTATDLFDLNGTSVKAPDGPGTYFRHAATAQMVQLADSRWVLALKNDDWSTTC
jgi:hypothetical protein